MNNKTEDAVRELLEQYATTDVLHAIARILQNPDGDNENRVKVGKILQNLAEIDIG